MTSHKPRHSPTLFARHFATVTFLALPLILAGCGELFGADSNLSRSASKSSSGNTAEDSSQRVLFDSSTNKTVLAAAVGGLDSQPATASDIGTTNPAVSVVVSGSQAVSVTDGSPVTVGAAVVVGGAAGAVAGGANLPGVLNPPDASVQNGQSISVKTGSNFEATAATPVAIELEDWTSGSAVSVGRADLNVEQTEIVWDDPDLASEMGVVKVKGVSRAIAWNGFEFGAVHFASLTAAEGRTRLDQVVVGAKPIGRWNSYPFADTFNPKTDTTIPPAFKVKLIAQSGAVLHTFQMSDGKAINDKSLSQTRNVGTGALRPFFNVGMLLPWQSSVPRVSEQARKLLPAHLPNQRESIAKMPWATNGAQPLLQPGANGKWQMNGYNHWHMLQRQPLAADAIGPKSLDPFTFDITRYWTGETNTKVAAWISGWDYEPGSISGHDWFTGPGGPRFDRSTMPAPLAYFATNPNYLRPQDKTPIREMVNAWGLAYFNHSGHYLRDVKDFKQIMNTDKDRRVLSQMGSYYGSRLPYSSLAESIDMRGISNGDYPLEGNNGGTPDQYFQDKNGNRFWNGWLPDWEHLHQTPYWHAIAFNSPMHILAARAAFNQSFLVRLTTRDISMRDVNKWFPGTAYATVNGRHQAYRWMHYSLMWKLGSTSQFGFKQADVERMFLAELHNWHDQILVPTIAETKNPYHVGLKRLGIPVQAVQQADGWYLKSDATPLQFYHAGLFIAMKKIGIWDQIRQDPKAKAVLDFVAQSMNKYSTDFMADTAGRAEDPSGTVTVAGPFARFEDINADSVPTWSEWSKRFPANGAETWVRDSSGVLKERYAGQYLRAQWTIMIRDWFPELATARTAAAAAQYEEYLDEWRAFIATKTTPLDKALADIQYMPISYSPFKKP